MLSAILLVLVLPDEPICFYVLIAIHICEKLDLLIDGVVDSFMKPVVFDGVLEEICFMYQLVDYAFGYFLAFQSILIFLLSISKTEVINYLLAAHILVLEIGHIVSCLIAIVYANYLLFD